jgi:hypothetical protein
MCTGGHIMTMWILDQNVLIVGASPYRQLTGPGIISASFSDKK